SPCSTSTACWAAYPSPPITLPEPTEPPAHLPAAPPSRSCFLPLPALAPRLDEDDHLAEADFRRISALIAGQTGIKLPPAKRLMVEGRLRRRLRALDLAGFAAYGD